jgi:hypothetical protein
MTRRFPDLAPEVAPKFVEEMHGYFREPSELKQAEPQPDGPQQLGKAGLELAR